MRIDIAKTLSTAAIVLVAMMGAGSVRAAPPPSAIQHTVFYVGGTYVGDPAKQLMRDQMYVEELTPAHQTHKYPLVLFHGLAQTAVNWMTTPDGREGWAPWFADHGWKVYMVDQPARGRSAWQPGLDGQITPLSAETVEQRFTAPEDGTAWPQAKLHTQWPGGAHKGHIGDPAFDQFYASQIPSLGNAETETLTQKDGAALLDRIGPAILIVHSQAGAFGWLIADVRPKLVKGIVALEPMGPPYKDALFLPSPTRPFGLTDVKLTYDPPVTDAAPLQFEQQAKPDAPDLAACWSEKGPPRTLPNLKDIPIAIVTTEASYHAFYDHCTSRYLTRAGVHNDFLRLADHGIHGNAHMMMLEKNNLVIAAFVNAWIVKHVK